MQNKNYSLVTLGDCCNIFSSKRIYAKEYCNEGVPFYRGKEIILKHNNESISNPLFINTDRFNEIKNKYPTPQKLDILLTAVGTIGIPWLVKNNCNFYFKDGNVVDIRCNKSLISPIYLYYWLMSKEGKNKIDQSVIGSTQKALTIDNIKKIKLNLPSIEKQNEIANLLDIFDSRIEYNNLTISKVQNIIKILFEKIKSNKNNKIINLREIADFYNGFSYTSNDLSLSNLNLGMLNIKNFGRDGSFKVDGYKGVISSQKIKPQQYAEIFDIVIAHTDITQNADIIGNAEIILSKAEFNSIIYSMDLVKVLPNEKFPYKFLLAAILQDKSFKNHCLRYVNGTTVLHLSKQALKDYKFKLSTDYNYSYLDNVFSVIYKYISNLTNQNIYLNRIKDLLLIKIFSFN